MNDNEPIKIMIYADAYNSTSGYSKVGKELAKRIAKNKEFEVYFQELITIDSITRQDNVNILPCFAQRGTKVFLNAIVHHLKIFGPHIFFPIGDTFLMNRDQIDKITFVDIKLIPYVMIDSDNLPDYSENILNKATKILTGSEHGQKQLKTYDYNSEVLYHGVDTSLYKPIEKDLKKIIRKNKGISEDKKVFLFIGRNFLRKRPMRLLEAIAKFNKKNPDNNALFYLHCSDHTQNGWDLELFKKRMEKQLNCNMDNVIFSEAHQLAQGITENDIIQLYQMSDYYLTSSSGEGFGLPIIEAMACKIPVIGPDNTTHTKFLKDNRGIIVENDGYSYVGYGTKQKIVDTDKLSETIENVLKMPDEEINKITENAYVWVKENCNWDTIAENLIKIFKKEVNKND